ncbi:MAG: ATP-binding protein [Proteobacteria bacterium]|nr:ATP-binding protein [Pseudomonadota bacterium]
MGDKRTFFFPSLLFATLFFLIAITGYFQIRIIKKNIEVLLKNEGEIIFSHLKREIDINLEYITLLEKSPSIITPNFLNTMVYDEAIIDDLYNLFSNIEVMDAEKIPISNLIVIDSGGKTVVKKGSVKITQSYIRTFQSGEKKTFVKTPSGNDKFLTMGIKTKGNAVFFSLDEAELDALRKKLTVKEIVEAEEKRFNIAGINIYDAKGVPYISSDGNNKESYVVSKQLDSQYLSKFTVEILVSKGLARDILKRTTMNFLFILVLLAISGAMSTYAIFLLERRHEKRVREFEKELEMKERLVSLGKLASGMAHEIRNPLNAVSMSIQRLKREFLPIEEKKDEYYQFIDIVRSELSRIDRIVEEFLLSTKSHAPFFHENLYNIIEEVVVILREKAASKGIDIIINKAGCDIVIQSQKERLKQALYNIILNGIEAIDNSGSIDITTVVKDGNVDISVRDTGQGIKGTELLRIFEYYYTTKDKGIGLGLPISYTIIKDHGGGIRAFSDAGKGTTFLISLPMNQPPEGQKIRE